MGKLSDFFTMTRRERMGAMAVLALIAIAIVLSWAVHRRTPSEPRDCPAPAAMEAFNAATDTNAPTEIKKRKARKKNSHRGTKKKDKKEKKARPAHQESKERSIDEMPSF